MMLDPSREEFGDIDGLEEQGGLDPMFGQIQAEEPADEEEEALYKEVMSSLGRSFYSEKAISGMAGMINSSDKELFEITPEIAKPLLMKAYQDGKALDPDNVATVIFGENGVLHNVNDMIFELAEQMGHPDASDPDQYAASLTAIYNEVGKHIDETKDTDSRKEVADMAVRMAMTNPDGSMQREPEPKQNPLTQEIQGLLGTGGGI